jgi:hypothetical protein
MKQQIANQQLKVDSLTDAANTGPIAGLSITGYLDPTYVYNRAASSSSFLFGNHEPVYNYFNSTFGDLYLDIKKTFGVGPMAPSAEITLMPNRGNGTSLLTNSRGGIGNNLLNTAVINVPLSSTTGAEPVRLVPVRRGGLDIFAGRRDVQRRTRLRPAAACGIQRRTGTVVRPVAARTPQIQHRRSRSDGCDGPL